MSIYAPSGHLDLVRRAIRGLAPRRRSAPASPCPACGQPVGAAEHAVRLRGDAFHADCALYQHRGAR